MRILNGKELGFCPNGTVFSDLDSSDLDSEEFLKSNGVCGLHGLHIMCGHDEKYLTVESGKFNGICHMVDYIYHDGTDLNDFGLPGANSWFDNILDIDYNDYTENDYVLVYDKEDIRHLIENLQWALNGCSRHGK